MSLDSIGFYTLSEERAKNSSAKSRLMRCELILTDKCNFHCPYCRGITSDYRGSVSLVEAKSIIDLWSKDRLRCVRFSGGEPTLWEPLEKIVAYSKSKGIEKIAISTNGSASIEKYQKLLDAGTNDFSVSFDACCSSTAQKMGCTNATTYETICNSIRFLSKHTYTTVGIVVTEENISELPKTIHTAETLGVSDIRIIPAAQCGKTINTVLSQSRKPILKYRLDRLMQGKPFRGISGTDNRKCPLVLDDMAILAGHHFPCIIYMREQGEPIGTIEGKTIAQIRNERKIWMETHDCYLDKICRDNCLDVCVDYNNAWLNSHLDKADLPKMESTLFTWQAWRNGNLKDMGVSYRYKSIQENRRLIKKHAIGWCCGESLPCRPKVDPAVMFYYHGCHFWTHIRKNEFYLLFSTDGMEENQKGA